MQALKTLVVLMGLLIVAGVALIGYGLVSTFSEEKKPGVRGESAEATITLPAGCTLAEARAGDGRLVLRGAGPVEHGCQQVIVLDPETGEVLSRITVSPGP